MCYCSNAQKGFVSKVITKCKRLIATHTNRANIERQSNKRVNCF